MSEPTRVYIFTGIVKCRVIMFDANKKLQARAECLQGADVYGREGKTIRFFFPNKESIMNNVYDFCRDNDCIVREVVP